MVVAAERRDAHLIVMSLPREEESFIRVDSAFKAENSGATVQLQVSLASFLPPALHRRADDHVALSSERRADATGGCCGGSSPHGCTHPMQGNEGEGRFRGSGGLRVARKFRATRNNPIRFGPKRIGLLLRNCYMANTEYEKVKLNTRKLLHQSLVIGQ